MPILLKTFDNNIYSFTIYCCLRTLILHNLVTHPLQNQNIPVNKVIVVFSISLENKFQGFGQIWHSSLGILKKTVLQSCLVYVATANIYPYFMYFFLTFKVNFWFFHVKPLLQERRAL